MGKRHMVLYLRSLNSPWFRYENKVFLEYFIVVRSTLGDIKLRFDTFFYYMAADGGKIRVALRETPYTQVYRSSPEKYDRVTCSSSI